MNAGTIEVVSEWSCGAIRTRHHRHPRQAITSRPDKECSFTITLLGHRKHRLESKAWQRHQLESWCNVLALVNIMNCILLRMQPSYHLYGTHEKDITHG